MIQPFSFANPGFVGLLYHPLTFGVCRYLASSLNGAHGSAVTLWPNVGTGGSAYDLVAAGTGTPWLSLGTGAGGCNEVVIPAGAYFTTASGTSPLTGTQSRGVWLVGRLGGTGDQDMLTLGTNAGTRACGIYHRTASFSWWVYGQNNSVRTTATSTTASFWRGQLNGSNFDIYVRSNTTASFTILASAVNSNPAGPLKIGDGYLLTRTSTLYVTDVGVQASFPSNTDVADLNTFFTATYSAPL
jgi:hypothetical protein